MPDAASPSTKRQRLEPIDPSAPAMMTTGDDAFIQDHDAVESGGDDDDEEEKPKSDKKAETGLVYTFTTAKLQPLVTQPEGKNLIQACLNAPHGQLPSSMPVGTPLGRSSGPMNVNNPHTPSTPSAPPNVPGGLAIGGKDEDSTDGHDGHEQVPGMPEVGPPPETNERASRKRRRTSGATTSPGGRGVAPAPPPSAAAAPPPTATSPQQTSPQQGPSAPSTSPHSRSAMPLPNPLAIPPGPGPTQQAQMQPQSPSYTAYPSGDPNGMYAGYANQPPPPGPPQYGYPPPPQGHDQQQAGMAWGPAPGVQQGGHYGRR
ncbi:hypothetical protein EW026_g4669 [Hermanssonia centrifuga]|uniref:Uncharacterized protein n=1 Tax=Hermanssonia centrifuga TaxID=98765 RepID=A0A4S4KKV9_9APHY|nr:hypothetical protein EW026_g4669 [Hermanssonia centrifuga]